MKPFFKEPTREFNVRELARIQRKAPATISKELKELKKAHLLKYRRERILHLYKANIEHESYQDLKFYYLKKQLRESGLLNHINNFYLKPTIILFGSASFGLDTETSDIDLFIISERIGRIADLRKFERKLHRSIQIICEKNMHTLKNKHLVNNIVNGIVLQGKIAWI